LKLRFVERKDSIAQDSFTVKNNVLLFCYTVSVAFIATEIQV